MKTNLVIAALALSGCATVEPGHVGLLFRGLGGGLQHDKLNPGVYYVAPFNHVDDFDITYSSRQEKIETTSQEGLHLTLLISLIYRPVVGELYDLDADIGLNYYDEVIGPEFRSAVRGVFAHHSYLELLQKNEQIEDELEGVVRRRTAGKHVEISSITMEGVEYAPEISRAVQEKLTAEQDAARQKTLLANEDLRRRTQIANEAEQAKLKAEAVLREKQQDVELAKKQSELDKIKEESQAATRLIRAKADAEQATYVAKAKSEEARAANQALTPLSVMQHGYDALKSVGESGNAHIYLGDWSKVPFFMMPPGYQAQLGAGAGGGGGGGKTGGEK
jgi:regulator of protease activity HflC (stomatin/prohibitin superfamily)